MFKNEGGVKGRLNNVQKNRRFGPAGRPLTSLFWLHPYPLLSRLIESCGPAAVWEPPGRAPLPLAGPPAGPWALQPAPAASKTPAAPPATAHRVIHTLHPLIPVSFTSQKIWDSEVQYQSQRLS